MLKNTFHRLAVAVVTMAISLAPASAQQDKAGPQKYTARVQVESKKPLDRVVGLLISSNHSEQIKDTQVFKLSDSVYEVVFDVQPAQVESNTVASALGVTKDEQIVFGSVTPALSTDPTGALFSVPDCPAEEVSPHVSQTDMPLLKSLVENREARRDLTKIKVNRIMSEDILAKLRKAEIAFGINRTSELASDLPPAELVDRLARLTFAFKEYKKLKAAQAESK